MSMDRRPFESDGDYIRRQWQQAYEFGERAKKARREGASSSRFADATFFGLALFFTAGVVVLAFVALATRQANIAGFGLGTFGVGAAVCWAADGIERIGARLEKIARIEIQGVLTPRLQPRMVIRNTGRATASRVTWRFHGDLMPRQRFAFPAHGRFLILRTPPDIAPKRSHTVDLASRPDGAMTVTVMWADKRMDRSTGKPKRHSMTATFTVEPLQLSA